MSSSVLRELRSPVVLVIALSCPYAFGQSSDCERELGRSNIVACAEAASPVLASELASLKAGEGRREAARPFLPSNPVLGASLSSRTGDDARAINWSVTLGQELEVAGQSGLRVEVAESELVASRHQVSVVRADVAEQIWLAYFELFAAQRRVTLAAEVSKAIADVAATVRGMAANGLAAEVEATVAEAAAIKAHREVFEAERGALTAELRLRSLIGASPGTPISGGLEPLQWKAPEGERPEAAALKALRAASSRRVALLRRGIVPNPTVSLFAQNDGFNERVLGVGLSLPVPLPQPLGRTRAGDLAEAVASEEKQQAALRQLERVLATELALARADSEASAKVVALYSPARRTEALQALTAIATQLRAARFPVREALASQQALVEFLNAEVEARRALCVASVRLVRASGGSLEGGDL